MADAPPDWVKRRAEAEKWREGTIERWLRNLQVVEVETVYPIHAEERLDTIEVGGLFTQIEWADSRPLDNALREAVGRLHANRPSVR